MLVKKWSRLQKCFLCRVQCNWDCRDRFSEAPTFCLVLQKITACSSWHSRHFKVRNGEVALTKQQPVKNGRRGSRHQAVFDASPCACVMVRVSYLGCQLSSRCDPTKSHHLQVSPSATRLPPTLVLKQSVLEYPPKETVGNHLGWVVTHNRQEWSLYFPTANPRDRSHSVSNFHLISNKTRNWFGNLFWCTAAGSKIKNTFLKKRTNILRFIRIFLNPKASIHNCGLNLQDRLFLPLQPKLGALFLSQLVFGCLWIPCCIAWSAWSSGVTI